MITGRAAVAFLALVLGIAGMAGAASAHHGWRWAKAGNFEITGVVQSSKLGYPHGEVTMLVKGERWTVEVGQPWRNQRAGLKKAMLAKGTRITVIGHRAKDESQRLVKAERVRIDGKTYVLYPDRD